MVSTHKTIVRITDHQFYTDKFKQWLFDNVGDCPKWQYYHIPDTGWAILFNNEVDAIIFKLTFSDEIICLK